MQLSYVIGLAVAVGALLGPINSAWSAEASREELEARIRDLDKRMLLLEQELAQTRAGRNRARPKIEGATQISPAPPPDEQRTSETRALDKSVNTLPEAKQEPPSDVPQEYNVFRDQIATLKRNKWDVAFSTSYLRQSNPFTKDRAVITRADIRYGILDGWEVGLTLPYYFTERVSTNIGGSTTRQVYSTGDIALQTNYMLFKETGDWPGMVVLAGVTFPTGKSPYTFANFSNGFVPIDPYSNILSRNLWQFGGGVQVFKTLDPILVFAGLRIDYALPRTFDGNTVEPGVRVSYNVGYSFALSEKITLGFSVSGPYDRGLYVNSLALASTAQEQHVARSSMILRMAKDFYLEPSVAWGLTANSPSFESTATVRARF